MSQEKKQGIQGIFSSQEVKRVGTGTTTRKTIQKMYWMCQEMPEGTIEVQPLNSNYIPSGPKKTVSMDEFLKLFSPEPEFYVNNVFPKIKEVNKTIARADRHRKNGEHYSAEMEYGNALKVDEENIRANFGLGITYLERGESGKAEDILNRLVKLEGAFEAEHKHLFNDFGINLRKNGMFDQAIAYYSRALELASHDENLHYNIARAYLEKKDVDKALEALLKGLSINPGQETLVKFLAWMLSKKLVREEQKPAVAQALQQAKLARERGSAAPASAPVQAPSTPLAPAPIDLPELSAPAAAPVGLSEPPAPAPQPLQASTLEVLGPDTSEEDLEAVFGLSADSGSGSFPAGG